MNQAVMRLEDYDTSERHVATVLSSERITPDDSPDEVREMVLSVDRPDFSYEVGQSVGVLAPPTGEFGNEYHLRLYSVADLPAVDESGNPQIVIRLVGVFHEIAPFRPG